jgi:dolichol-phosphate mannosyltransferase
VTRAVKSLLSVVAPAFNEEDNVGILYRAILKEVAPCEVDLQIVLVDDGSRDSTRDRIAALAAHDSRVTLVALTRNFGHQAALLAGLQAAEGDAVITMDCDMQHPPACIPAMVAAWREGYQVVQMIRSETLDASWAKRLFSHAFYRMINLLSETRVLAGAADFQLLDRVALDGLLRLGDHRPFLRGMVAWLGYRRTAITYVAPARLHGKSSYSWTRMIRLAVDALTAFSSKPLRLAFYTGMAVMSLCLIYLVFIAWSVFTGSVVEGWTSLMVALLLLSAVQLLTIGIMGEYIGRIYDQTRNRPRFLVMPPDEKEAVTTHVRPEDIASATTTGIRNLGGGAHP